MDDLTEAALVDDITVLGAHSLAEIADWLRGDDTALQLPGDPAVPLADRRLMPMRELTAAALHAVMAAAAGGHHLLLDIIEPAGTMVAARWLHALLPVLTTPQQLEVAAIRSLTGPRDDAVLVSAPPMVHAHYSHSSATLIGADVPGEVSRAHHDLLVTGELDQLGTAALESLRFALQQREVMLARGGYACRYPANFQLFATCVRAPGHRRSRLPLALLDTIDIQLTADAAGPVVNPAPRADEQEQVAQILATIRPQVAAARPQQRRAAWPTR